MLSFTSLEGDRGIKIFVKISKLQTRIADAVQPGLVRVFFFFFLLFYKVSMVDPKVQMLDTRRSQQLTMSTSCSDELKMSKPFFLREN